MLIKGWSRVEDANDIVDGAWLQLARCGTNMQFVYVASKANLADGPSRRDLGLMQHLGSQPVDAVWPR